MQGVRTMKTKKGGGHFTTDREIDVDDVSVSGGALAPRDPSVSLSARTSAGDMGLYFTPEEAQELAKNLLDAAERARREAGIIDGGNDA